MYTDRDTSVAKYLEKYEEAREGYLQAIKTGSTEETKNALYKTIKKAMRGRAKNARFAMFYGAGVAQTASTLGLTIEEVDEGYMRDEREWPEFYALMDECTRIGRKQAYIETFFGRKLRVNPRQAYTATDYMIQGTAGDLFKRAQVAVYRWLEKEVGLEKCMPVLPVHDELIFEVRRDMLKDLPELLQNVKREMISFPEITVPLNIEFNLALYNWADKKELAL
jgi:DNA polymerase I-like protein with 3'-5' exonuclease and polymerase domains